MSHHHWRNLSLAVAVLLAMTFLWLVNSGREESHAQQGPSLALDMDITNGSGPCNPIDTSRSDAAGGPSYQVAVCLVNATTEPMAFEFSLVYDDTLNMCLPNTNCTTNPNTTDPHCLDSNPDANAGSTTFSTPSLGTGNWDCTGAGALPPTCDYDPAAGPGHGRAILLCLATTGNPTLPVGAGVASPIAVVTFTAIAGGVDTLSLDRVGIWDRDQNLILGCPDGPGECLGGVDTKSGPTPPPPTATPTPVLTPAPPTPSCGLEGLPTCTPTPKPWTATPTPTRTPVPPTPTPVPPTPTRQPGVGGIVKLPPASVAAVYDEASEGSGWAAWAPAVLAAGGVAGLVVALAAGGLCAARRRES